MDAYLESLGFVKKGHGTSKEYVSNATGLENDGFIASYSHVNYMDLNCSDLESTLLWLRVPGDEKYAHFSKYNHSETKVQASLEIATGVETFFGELIARL